MRFQFDAQIVGEYDVVVALGIGKEEVGLVVVFSDGLLLKYNFIGSEDVAQRVA